MPYFKYSAVDKTGQKISSTEEANNEESLVAKLQARGLVVVNVSLLEPGTSKTILANLKKQKTFTHNRVKLQDLVIFSRQLATMLDSGVTLLRSLEIVSQQVESKKLSESLSRVKSDLEQGVSFSNTLAKHPKVFSQFWVSLVEVGEASGTLPAVLEKVVHYLEQKAAFQSKVKSALLYPAILLILCIVAVAFFALVIIPRFTEMFKNMGIKLPFLTQVMIFIFETIRTKFLLFILLIGGIIVFIKNYIKTSLGLKQFEAFLFKLPVFGNFYRIFMIERFASQLSILVESGVPILYALEITQRMIGNKTMEEVIGFVKNNVREGKLIAEPMSQSQFFTPMVVQMVLVGEETGELSKMLKKVASFYQDYVETFTTRFTTIFEPFMLVFMGAVVGTIVIAMYLPIFSIATMGGGGMK